MTRYEWRLNVQKYHLQYTINRTTSSDSYMRQ